MQSLPERLPGLAALAVLSTLAAGIAAPLHAEDWPQWRGPARDGIWRETGILEAFPEDGLEVTWRQEIGNGYSGPAVADGRIFVTDFLPDEGKKLTGRERIHALREETGEILWTHTWEASYGPLLVSWATGPRATPTVDGDRVYALGAVGHLLALEAATGKVLWEKDYAGELDASIPIWGTASAPLVFGDLLICITGAEPDGKVIAFDKRTGEERWRAISSDQEMGYGQPLIVDRGGRLQLIIWHPHAVTSLDPESGEEYWSVPWEVPMGMTVATPVLDGEHIFFSQFYRGSMMLRFAEDEPAASIVWQRHGESEMPADTVALHSMITTPILEGDRIYGVDSYGELRGLEASTGDRVWAHAGATRQGRWGTAFMVRNADRYFMNNGAGELLIARFEPDGFVEIDRTQLIEPTSKSGQSPRRDAEVIINWSHPAYANRHVITRNDGTILRASLAAPAPD